MGEREEKRVVRMISGHAGPSRPEQILVGNCHVCKTEVWTIPTKEFSKEYELKFIHYSCR